MPTIFLDWLAILPETVPKRICFELGVVGILSNLRGEARLLHRVDNMSLSNWRLRRGYTTPIVGPDQINCPSINAPDAKIHYHVFFIPGNPGCIRYYTLFLILLFEELRKLEDVRISVDGVSLWGFDSCDFGIDDRPKGLQEQIALVEQLFKGYVRVNRDDDRKAGKFGPSAPTHKVIIVGHSVGAYIGMEVMRRLREEEREGRRQEGTNITRELEGKAANVLGFIGLWPTITWIGRSPRGKLFGVSRLPNFVVQLLNIPLRCH